MYLHHAELDKYWIVDAEFDGLSPTRCWVVCVENAARDEEYTFTDYESVGRFFRAPGQFYVGHNFLSFDAPNFNRLVGTSISVSRVVDTLVLSHLYSPVLEGGHALEAWAERMGGEKKVHHEDWSRLSPEMIERCRSDVRINKRLFLKLTARMAKLGFTEKACEIEHRFRHVINQQQRNGFAFDLPEAEALRAKLGGRLRELEESVHNLFPPELKPIKTYPYRTTKAGKPYSSYLRHLQEYPLVRRGDGDYTVHDYVPFNLGSPVQRVDKLQSLGWVPTKFTPKGNPKVDEESLMEFALSANVPEAEALAKWIVFAGRHSAIGTWLDNYNEDTGCIHGKVNTCGAGTTRCTHSSPNSANIPRVRTRKAEDGTKYPLLGEDGAFTYESRALWTTRDRDNRRLVGYDASGLEFRMLAHYINDKEFTSHVCDGDIHAFNMGLFGIDDRDRVKTTIYAIIYGARDPKVGAINGGSASLGKQIRERAFSKLPGLRAVAQQSEREFQQGRIIGVDGRRLICPSPHAALNYKLQGGGSTVMKQTAIFVSQHVRRAGLDVLKVGDIHDESQADVAIGDVEEYGNVALRSLREAGEELNLNVPITGEWKAGFNWAETH